MNRPVPAVVPCGLPDPEHHLRLARLETKITELAAHINAATFQLLKLICEYDEQDGWWQHGVASCAHRELSWCMDGDGMWVFKGKFTAEQGALIARALEGAMDELFEEQQNEPSDVSAETPTLYKTKTKKGNYKSPPKRFHPCGRER